MSQAERREEPRIKLWIMIQYERVLSEGNFDIPVTTPIRDISKGGLSFYSLEKLDINSKLRITMYVSDRDFVTFQAIVVKVMHSAATDGKFIIATKIEPLEQETVNAIEQFLNKVNLYTILDSIDLIIVPAIGFDLKGNRLGHGLGYYDRLLKKSKNATHIGLAFEFQIMNQIKVEEYDIPVNIIITEKRIIYCR